MNALKMLPDNEQKIRDGRKTATTRTFEIPLGKYRINDSDLVIDITCKANVTVDVFKDAEAYAIAEGYESIKDMKSNCKFKHTKQFLKGEIPLWVYKFNVFNYKLPI